MKTFICLMIVIIQITNNAISYDNKDFRKGLLGKWKVSSSEELIPKEGVGYDLQLLKNAEIWYWYYGDLSLQENGQYNLEGNIQLVIRQHESCSEPPPILGKLNVNEGEKKRKAIVFEFHHHEGGAWRFDGDKLSFDNHFHYTKVFDETTRKAVNEIEFLQVFLKASNEIREYSLLLKDYIEKFPKIIFRSEDSPEQVIVFHY